MWRSVERAAARIRPGTKGLSCRGGRRISGDAPSRSRLGPGCCDELRNLGIGADGFDEDHGFFVDDHAVWSVPFLAALHQDFAHGFGFRVLTALDVVDVFES